MTTQIGLRRSLLAIPHALVGVVRRKTGRLRVSLLLSALLAAVGVSSVVEAPSASADTVWGYGGAVIMVTTGGKDYGSQTQWVSSITVVDPGSAVCDGGTYEAWAGSVSYASRVPCSPYAGGTMNAATFYVSRWVPSGSGVCGSFWRWYSRVGWYRQIACITIRV
jgi:hypothetical protein